MTYKIGDKIKLTTKTYGEAVTDRRGMAVWLPPYIATYIGIVKSVGPECGLNSATVVRCTGGNVELGLHSGFQFYPLHNGPDQVVQVMEYVVQHVPSDDTEGGEI